MYIYMCVHVCVGVCVYILRSVPAHRYCEVVSVYCFLPSEHVPFGDSDFSSWKWRQL